MFTWCELWGGGRWETHRWWRCRPPWRTCPSPHPPPFHFICSSVCLIPPIPSGTSLLSTLSIRSSMERRVTRIRDRDCPTSNTAVLFCLDPPEGAGVSVEMVPQAPEVTPEPFPLVLLATIVSLSSPAGNISNKNAFQLKTNCSLANR